MVFFKNTFISKIWEDLGSLRLKKNPPVSIETIQSLLQWKMSPKDTQSLRSHNSSCYKVLREWSGNGTKSLTEIIKFLSREGKSQLKSENKTCNNASSLHSLSVDALGLISISFSHLLTCYNNAYTWIRNDQFKCVPALRKHSFRKI